MKFLPSQLTYLLGQREMRTDIKALLKYLGVLAATIVMFSALFHVIMLREVSSSAGSRASTGR